MIRTIRRDDLNAESHLLFVKALAEGIEEPALIMDARTCHDDPVIVYTNPAFTDETGFRSDDVSGKPLSLLLAAGSILQDTRPIASSATPGTRRRITQARRDGTRYEAEWEMMPLRDTCGQDRFYILVQM